MLKQDNFLVYRFWIVEEVVRCDLFGHCFTVLDWLLGPCPDLLDVVKVEQVGVGDNLGGVIEEHTVRAIGQLVSETILGGEVHELGHQFSALLCLTLGDQ